MRRGFSLLEIVLSIGVLSALFFVGVQAESVMQNVLAGRGSRQMESVLATAAQKARNGQNGTGWGVYLSYDNTTKIATQAVIFSGNTYAARDVTKDLVFPLGRTLRFTNVSLSGAGVSSGVDHEIDFAYLSGATVQYGTITIANFASTTQITLPATGIAVRQ